MTSKKDVQSMIEEAFSGLEFPGAWNVSRVSATAEETQAVYEAFKDKTDWRALPWDFVDQAPDNRAIALHYLSDVGFRFYVPAYLLADLEKPLLRADPSFHLVHPFSGDTKNEPLDRQLLGEMTRWDVGVHRFSVFSRHEIAALAAYLDYQGAVDEELDDHERSSLNEALANYYVPRLRGELRPPSMRWTAATSTTDPAFEFPEPLACEDVDALIHEAFADVVYPGDWNLAGPSRQTSEAFEVAQEFKGKTDWRALDPAFLDQAPNYQGSALSFMSDMAYMFYLPAYLSADLKHPFTRADVTSALTTSFSLRYGFRDPVRTFGERCQFEDGAYRASVFSKAQIEAIAAFLTYKAQQDGSSYGRAVREAIALYYAPRFSELSRCSADS